VSPEATERLSAHSLSGYVARRGVRSSSGNARQTANVANLLTCGLLTMPTSSTMSNVQFDSFASS